MGTGRRVCLAAAVAVLAVAATARGSAEVKVDRDFLAGLVEKLPPAPFGKEGQYRGSARAFRLVAIDPKGRRLVVSCEVGGEFRPPVAGAVRRAVTPPGAGSRPASEPRDDGWKAFTFDVRAAVRAEPGPDGVPKFSVDVEEVKRRDLEGVAGAIARVLGRHFDQIVTQVADGKAALLNRKLNEQVAKKVEAFKEYGVLREVGYEADQVVLTFDVTKFRSEGVAGYVFPGPQPGTVPLYRWVRPRLGDRIYSTSPAPLGLPYYVYEGVACYVYRAPAPGTVPLSQWRSPRERILTTGVEKAETLPLVRQGYRPEAVAAHVLAAPAPGAVPFYRFVDPRTGVHFFTTHPHAEFAK